MGATGSDARGGIGDNLTQVFRGHRAALVGGVGIVVERHEAVLLYNSFGPCYSILATELCLLWHLDVRLSTLESGLLIQRLQQFLIRLEVDALDEDVPVFVFRAIYHRIVPQEGKIYKETLVSD